MNEETGEFCNECGKELTIYDNELCEDCKLEVDMGSKIDVVT